MVNASFLKFRVCTKWRQGDVYGCLHKVSPGSYPLLRGHVVTCLDPTAALHRVPATAGSVTVSGNDGDDVLACGTHNPKLQNLDDGSWVPHFGAIAAIAICDAANCSGENLSALLDNNLRRQPGFE
jgi:hypothetical protein